MNVLDLNHTPTATALSTARAVLAAGGLVIFPTETTYGAGVDATNQAAVNKLLAYKSRREGKPLSIAVVTEAEAAKYVDINPQAHALYTQFLPGPVTIVSKSLGAVAQGVESEFGTLGVRIPDYPFMLELCSTYGKPITATSANGSGAKRPYSIADILSGLSENQKSLVDLVLDAGELPHNPPSTVIDTTLSAPVTLRSGSISLGAKATDRLISTSEAETQAIAGRLLLKHWDDLRQRGLLITLDGALGMGKTIFTKGVAKFLQIQDVIVSPTYTYIEEYPFVRHQTEGTLYHLDMWKVDSAELFARLEVSALFGPNKVVVIEWFDQVAPYLDLSQPGAPAVIQVRFSQTGDERVLEIRE